ncbi:MAG: 30S ribosomal protein S6 [Candidatus Kerfeldbacteria bacterium]|nr:30S ribosomal protein S6 [Candidatus Kerfeldbacteria bacterium]
MPKASAQTADMSSEVFEMPKKEVSMQHYEMLMLLPGSNTEEEAAATSKEVAEFLTAQNCEITKQENLGRKSLGYTVAGSRNGTYMLYEFNTATSQIAPINEKLRIRKDVARFLIVKKVEKTEEQLKEEARVKGIIDGRKAVKKAAMGDVAEKTEEAPKKTRRPAKKAAETPENIDKEIDKLIDSEVK